MFAVTLGGGQCLSPADVCQVPTPAGPVPTPFPNIALPPTADPAAEKILISGMPALNLSSEMNPTNGDQAGAAGGVVSGVIMGPAKFTMGSMTVMFQGQPAVRLSGPTTQNQNNCVGTCIAPSQSVVMIQS